MKFRILLILIFLFKTFDLSAQDKLEIGKHIHKDKLTYITLKENNDFEYLKHYKWSPFTIMEKQKNEGGEDQIYGHIGYVSGAKGKGEYEIHYGKLILKFSEFKKYMDKKSGYDEDTQSMEFDIADFIN